MAKQHTFRSFKERIRDLKIEPNAKIGVRSFDYTETSFFTTTISHWKEINISGNFTSCVDKLEPISRSLPQVIHHKEAIYDILELHVLKQDIHSLQPLLECLTQFIHDLGPEFMPLYQRYTSLITTVTTSITPNDSQSMKNSSFVLEWCFNSLAFSFRYLSEELTSDLWKTFEQLLPLLRQHKKAHLGRFCGEAISYLLRKLSSASYENFISCLDLYLRDTEVERDFVDAIIVLFSEALKSANNSLHSKTRPILAPLLRRVVLGDQLHSVTLFIIAKITSELLHHVCVEDGCSLSEIIWGEIQSHSPMPITSAQIHSMLFLCLTTIFVENGRKVRVDSNIAKMVKNIFSNFECQRGSEDEFRGSLLMIALFINILVRNTEVAVSASLFPHIWETIKTFDNECYLFGILDMLGDSSPDKLQALRIDKLFQQTLNSSRLDFGIQRLSLIVQRGLESGECRLDHLTIPKSLKDRLVDSILQETKVDEHNVTKLSWMCNILTLRVDFDASDCEKAYRSLTALQTRFALQTHYQNHQIARVSGQLLSFCMRNSEFYGNESTLTKLCDTVRKSLQSYRANPHYLISVQEFLSKAKITEELSKELNKTCVQNLSSPDRSLRLASLSILSSLNPQNLDIYNQLSIIDQMPLEVSNTYDVKMRIKGVFKYFSTSIQEAQEQIIETMSNSAIGLLSNRFQPCWQAVHEGLRDSANGELLEAISSLIFEKLTSSTNSRTGNDINSMSSEVRCFQKSCIESLENDDGVFKGYYKKILEMTPTSHEELSMLIHQDAELLNAKEAASPELRLRLISCVKEVPKLIEANKTLIDKLLLLILLGENDTNWRTDEKIIAFEILSTIRSPALLESVHVFDESLQDALGSKNPRLQKAALDGYLSLHPEISQYRDSLHNLLDDKLFKEELMNLVNGESEGKIQESHERAVMPIVLNILFGKVQGSSRKNSKSNVKSTVAFLLPSLHPRFIDHFIAHMSKRIPWKTFFSSDDNHHPCFDNLKIMSGFIKMLTEVYDSLGYKYSRSLIQTLKPLIFVLICVQDVSEARRDEESSSHLKNLRQSALRCLVTFDKLAGNDVEWESVMPVLYSAVLLPRMKNFASENTQQTSALLEFILNRVQNKDYIQFFKKDDWLPIRVVMSLLANKHTKEEVVISILDCIISIFTKRSSEGNSHTLLAILVEGLLECLPKFLEESKNKETLTRCSTLLLFIVEGSFISEEKNKIAFLNSSIYALQKSSFFIRNEDKVSILTSIALIIQSGDIERQCFERLLRVCAGILRFSKDYRMRRGVCNILGAVASKDILYEQFARNLDFFNSCLSQNSDNFDLNKVLDGFDYFNSLTFEDLPQDSWELLIANCLFYMDNLEESVLRINALNLLKSVVSIFTEVKDDSRDQVFTKFFERLINPAIHHGLSNPLDEIRSNYIDLLESIVASELLPMLSDLKLLTSENEMDDFFANIQHLQLSARQKATRNLIEKSSSLTSSSIEQYIVPILENYLICKDEKYRNLSEDSQKTFGYIASSLPWQKFNGHLKKYISLCSSSNDVARDAVKVTVQLIQNLSSRLISDSHKINIGGSLLNPSEVEKHVVLSIIHPLKRILSMRDDSTIVYRLPLLEACVLAIIATSPSVIHEELPGILIGTCQVLRSKSQELRDSARKALCKACRIMGAKYLFYIVRELRAALSRGSQIHVLSYTVNAILKVVHPVCGLGDLDTSAPILIDIIMEDIFGSAGKEKDSEGYHSKMKEVKAKKSFDSVEMLCSKLSFDHFDTILSPVKTLFKQSLPYKTGKALDELLRRVCQGILSNEKSDTTEMLILCFEIHKSSMVKQESSELQKNAKEEAHFMVDLKLRREVALVKDQQYGPHLQRIALELLGSVIRKHSWLLDVKYLAGFIPLLFDSLQHGDERLTIAVLRVAILIVKLEFESDGLEFFEEVTKKSTNAVLESPSTKSEICQVSLKFIAASLMNQKAKCCSEDSIRALLIKITPDLEDPEKQSLAFGFVKSVIASRICTVEVYDLMEKVLKIMVVNHHREIRDMARGLYFKFMLQYNQGSKRLESSFKFLVDNLGYPTPSGRQSVMELMHSIVLRSPDNILQKISSSFFVGLANVAVSDESEKCREMAIALIEQILSNVNDDKADFLVKLMISWLMNKNRALLRRCGLITYKAYLKCFGYRNKLALDEAASSVVKECLENSNMNSSTSAHWEDIYMSLDILRNLMEKYHVTPWTDCGNFWDYVSDCLLYPHAWIRLLSSGLIESYINNVDKGALEADNRFLQTVAIRLLRQLAAPEISEKLCSASSRNLSRIFIRWEKHCTKYLQFDGEDEEDHPPRYIYASDIIIQRCSSLLKKSTSIQSSNETKKVALKLTADIALHLSEKRLYDFAMQFVTSLIGAEDTGAYEETTCSELALHCLKVAEDRLGTVLFSKLVTAARAEISLRRTQRKAKRAQLKIDAPEKAAERNQKKHTRFREKRKNNKDEYGYYKPKKRRL